MRWNSKELESWERSGHWDEGVNGRLIVAEGAVGGQLNRVGITLESLCEAPHGSLCEAVKGGKDIQIRAGSYREGTLVL